ncbi:alcohol dehydrogenase [Legionella busanensis]|uniref:Aldehyde dehydrogenase n=1 Tax=Legionella busanensis TaxID=190655 RepID=A0A378JLZ3_9GAMM|nr:aldehyde dehydrogenase family protein [Legionella busanensis]STX51323.1 alcohol dehydrogenase [Legionella busanensis]
MTDQDELLSSFENHQRLFASHPYLPVATRLKHLRLLKKMLQHHALGLAETINTDYMHRAREETLLLEIFPTINAINYCLKNLKKWVKPRKRKIDWYFGTGKAHIIAQPIGVIGIIAPWNYPIFLSMVPLAYGLAAGNQVMIKMSEFTPNVGQKLQELIELIPGLNEYVSIHNGDIAYAEKFTSLPFAHLLFTGSTSIGKKVMATASKNLTPVTLELGGKSPTIISSSANARFLNRIFMGKLFNAGQTCLAPDFLLIARKWENDIERLATQFMQKHYPDMTDSKQYSNIISNKHSERLLSLLEDARAKGGNIVQLGDLKESRRALPLYLIFNANSTMQLMKEEIFGPLLPIIVYDTFKEAVDFISSLPNPLAIYYFGNDNLEVNQLQYETLSGALAINDTVTQAAIDDLPFGGVGQSGIGRYHGQEGFDTFSNLKPIFKQGRLSAITFFYPPYGKLLYYFLKLWAGIRFSKNSLDK